MFMFLARIRIQVHSFVMFDILSFVPFDRSSEVQKCNLISAVAQSLVTNDLFQVLYLCNFVQRIRSKRLFKHDIGLNRVHKTQYIMLNVFSESSDGRHALEMGKNARFL